MNAQSRMAKTLGCLVGSMTVGALILHWIQPAAPPFGSDYAFRLIAREVKGSVEAQPAPDSPSWRAVEIAAGAPTEPSHFRITRAGQLTMNEAWRRQSGIEVGTIRVIVDPPAHAESVSAQQIDTLHALLTELRRAYLTPEALVSLNEASFWRVRGGRAAAEELYRALAAAGMTVARSS